jgi:hypothetical protein
VREVFGVLVDDRRFVHADTASLHECGTRAAVAAAVGGRRSAVGG